MADEVKTFGLTRKSLIDLIMKLKAIDARLMAYEMLLDGMNHAYPEENLIQKLKDLGDSPLLEGEMREKYDQPLERLLKSADAFALDLTLAKWCQEANPKKQPN
jgi:hypothetical protein